MTLEIEALHSAVGTLRNAAQKAGPGFVQSPDL
jgi:hypothetical protein